MDIIHEYEIEWMLSKRPLVYDPKQLAIDYGEKEAYSMLQVNINNKIKIKSND